MLFNKVHRAGESTVKPFSAISQEEVELVDKALYTGHAVFWEDGVTMIDSGYPELNKMPGYQVRQNDGLVE